VGCGQWWLRAECVMGAVASPSGRASGTAGVVMVRARSAVVASLLAAGVVLAGCGGPQEPKPLEEQQNAQDNAPDDAGGDQRDDSGDEGSSNGDDSTPSDQGTGGANHGPAQGMDYEPVDKQTEAQVEKVALKFSSEYDKLLAGEPSTV